MVKPIFSAACPCCAGGLFMLSGPVIEDERLGLCGALVWSCATCGFSMMGLAVPVQWRSWLGHMLTVIDVNEITQSTPVRLDLRPLLFREAKRHA